MKRIYSLNLSIDFLLPITIGIVISALLFAQALEHFDLLDENKEFTLSYFFGLILASIPLIIKMISKWKHVHTFCFLIGSEIGLDDSLKDSNLSISFGKQTWPHLLVRILLIEQIYRSLEIIKGSPYHK